VAGRLGEEFVEGRRIARRHRQAGQGEAVRPPLGGDEARLAADGELANTGIVGQTHQIGGVAVDGEQIGEHGVGARFGEPGVPAFDVLQPVGRIADELDLVAIRNPAPDAAHRDVREDRFDVVLRRLQRDVDRVPARLQGDGLGHVGRPRCQREQQQGQRGDAHEERGD